MVVLECFLIIIYPETIIYTYLNRHGCADCVYKQLFLKLLNLSPLFCDPFSFHFFALAHLSLIIFKCVDYNNDH
jgi:hypothetical protein